MPARTPAGGSPRTNASNHATPSSTVANTRRPCRGARCPGGPDARGTGGVGSGQALGRDGGSWLADGPERPARRQHAEEWRLTWTLDSDGGLGRDQFGRELELSPFLGVMGMPPPEPVLTRLNHPVFGAGTSIARSSSQARPCTCRFRSTVPDFPQGTATPARETARSRRSRSSAPSSAPSSRLRFVTTCL